MQMPTYGYCYKSFADVVSTSGSRVDKWDMYLMELAKYRVFTHIVVKPEAVDRVKQEWRAVTELGEITVGEYDGYTAPMLLRIIHLQHCRDGAADRQSGDRLPGDGNRNPSTG